MKYIAILLCLLLLSSCTEKANLERIPLGGENETSNEDTAAECTVTLSEAEAEIDGDGAELKDGILYLTKGGTYRLQGELVGSVVVEIPKTDKADIVLGGVRIASSSSSAIYVKSADKVNLVLEGENYLSDGDFYADDDGAEPSGCIFSADDIEISGNGSLTVYGNCKNGIESKNDVRISGGSIKITAARNAVKGKDSVEISGGNIKIVKCYDGIKSDNEKEEGRGNVTISGGSVEMNCTDDGIQAYRSVTVTGGSVIIRADDDKINCDGEISVSENCIN